MAENFLFDFVGAIADKLSTLASQEIASCFGVTNEISNLKETISTIQSVLLDAEDLQQRNESLKAWLGELKEAFYDADDLLDDLCVEAQRRRFVSPASFIIKEVCLVFSCSNSLVNGVKLGRKIRAIREKLDNVAARRTEFNLMERLTETPFLSRERREEIVSIVGEEMVFGREGDKMEIINCLLRDDSVEDENVSVVPIVGIGGLGKTTLVQLVYNDELVERHFDLKMWVHVSDVFDVKLIAERVIVSATGRKLEDVGLNQLQAHLRKHFDGMRFLLVLDDVRVEDLEKWRNLRQLFVFSARGSKIIVTTRSMVVANIAGTLPPYNLGGLFSQGKLFFQENLLGIVGTLRIAWK